MLTADQIKPHLLDEDPLVRDAAVDYFGDSWSQDPDLVPMVLEACQRYGAAENLGGLVACSRFPLTEPALDLVLTNLAAARDQNVAYHLNQVIAHAPIELWIRREAAIRANPHFDPQLIPRLQRRRDLAAWSGDKLWEELQDFARRSEDQHYVGSIDHAYADALLDALAVQPMPDTDTVCRLLRSPEAAEGWLEIFLIDLAGTRRLREAVPALVEKFHVDTDYMLERCVVALARIGDPEAARLIRSAVADPEGPFRMFTSDVLGKIKHPESEDAILFLLETEQDATIRTALCSSLCKLFSARGVEVVRHEIQSGYDRWFSNLEGHLLAVAPVLGIELPEAEQWRQERAKQQRLQAKRRAELEEIGKRHEALKKQGIDPFARLGGARESKPVPSGQPAYGGAGASRLDKSLPFEHTQPRVGRNDPCPCGSGKKFKNCCARKA
jgi:hypothetical protein